nr:hypothetical protein [Tanacetum cinerariifolium]
MSIILATPESTEDVESGNQNGGSKKRRPTGATAFVTAAVVSSYVMQQGAVVGNYLIQYALVLGVEQKTEESNLKEECIISAT